jgi:hypothetical protein
MSEVPAHDLVRQAARRLPGRPVTPHHAVSQIDADNRAWVRRFELVAGDIAAARHAAIRCASFAAHTYAHRSSVVALLGADLISWLFLFDDRYGEGARGESASELEQNFATYERTVRDGTLPTEATPFHRALLDLRARALAIAGPKGQAWVGRFADSFAVYFAGCVKELPFRRAAEPPDLDTYRIIRSESVGAYPVFDLIELEGALLEPHEVDAVSTSRHRAALLCAWVNDIYSFPKERADADPLNLVTVLKRQYGLTADEAMGAAVQVFEIDLAIFDASCAKLRETPLRSSVEAYLRGLDQWVHGNTAWTATSGRYGE